MSSFSFLKFPAGWIGFYYFLNQEMLYIYNVLHCTHHHTSSCRKPPSASIHVMSCNLCPCPPILSGSSRICFLLLFFYYICFCFVLFASFPSARKAFSKLEFCPLCKGSKALEQEIIYTLALYPMDTRK